MFSSRWQAGQSRNLFSDCLSAVDVVLIVAGRVPDMQIVLFYVTLVTLKRYNFTSISMSQCQFHLRHSVKVKVI